MELKVSFRERKTKSALGLILNGIERFTVMAVPHNLLIKLILNGIERNQ